MNIKKIYRIDWRWSYAVNSQNVVCFASDIWRNGQITISCESGITWEIEGKYTRPREFWENFIFQDINWYLYVVNQRWDILWVKNDQAYGTGLLLERNQVYVIVKYWKMHFIDDQLNISSFDTPKVNTVQGRYWVEVSIIYGKLWVGRVFDKITAINLERKELSREYTSPKWRSYPIVYRVGNKILLKYTVNEWQDNQYFTQICLDLESWEELKEFRWLALEELQYDEKTNKGYLFRSQGYDTRNPNPKFRLWWIEWDEFFIVDLDTMKREKKHFKAAWLSAIGVYNRVWNWKLYCLWARSWDYTTKHKPIWADVKRYSELSVIDLETQELIHRQKLDHPWGKFEIYYGRVYIQSENHLNVYEIDETRDGKALKYDEWLDLEDRPDRTKPKEKKKWWDLF